MGSAEIVGRILSDADEECAKIRENALKEADAIVGEAAKRAEERLENARREAQETAKGIEDGKAAAARLDCAKVELEAKRRVLDGVYKTALKQLVDLDERSALALSEKLLELYAEGGDEIFFAQNFAYAEKVAALPVIKAKRLKISKEKKPLGGGFILKGSTSDKDLSYPALLKEDMESNLAALAAELFGRE